MDVPVIPRQRVGRFAAALGQQLEIAGNDLVEGLHLVHHADTPGQATVVKAAGEGQPAETGDRPAAPALLRQIVKADPRILQPFRGEVIIMVAIDDITLKPRVRYAGPALQILGKGQ